MNYLLLILLALIYLLLRFLLNNYMQRRGGVEHVKTWWAETVQELQHLYQKFLEFAREQELQAGLRVFLMSAILGAYLMDFVDTYDIGGWWSFFTRLFLATLLILAWYLVVRKYK